MEIQQTSRWLLFVFVIHVCHREIFVQAQQTFFCNDNIVVMANNIRDKNRCNYVSTKPMSWQHAWEYCHSRSGWLVNCPSCRDGQGAYIGDELLAYNGISSIWTGIHIDEHRLVQDDFPTPSKQATLRQNWNNTGFFNGDKCVIEEFQQLACLPPSDGEELEPNDVVPSEGGNEPRVPTEVTFPPTELPQRRRRKRNALPSKIPENCSPIYKQRFVPCSEMHTFACYFSGMNSLFNMGPVKTTEQKTVVFGKEGLDRQFYLTREKAYRNGSDAVCEKTLAGGQAMRARTETSKRVILSPLSTAIQSNAKLMGLTLDDLKRTLYWHQSPKGECKAALLSFAYSDTGDNFASMYWPCTAALPVICEVPVILKESAAPEVLFFDLDRLRYNVLGGQLRLTSFSLRNGGTIQVACSVPPSFRQFQSITLYRNGIPLSMTNYNLELGPTTPLIVLGSSERVITYMDLFRCEINSGDTNELNSSDPVLLRVSDFEVYAMSIEVIESANNKDLWTDVYLKSLADTLAEFTENSVREPILNEDEKPDLDNLQIGNVFVRLRDLIERTEQWEIEAVEFLVKRDRPSRLVFYAYREFFFENEGDEPNIRDLNLQNRLTQVEKLMKDILTRESRTVPELNTATVRLYSIDNCWPKTLFVKSINREYKLPEALGGVVWKSPQTCAQDSKPLVTVECEGSRRIGYDWGEEKVNHLCDYSNPSDETEESEITDDLLQVSQEIVTVNNIGIILERTKNLTSQVGDSELQPIDVALIADIMQKSSEVEDLTTDQVQDVLDTVTRITNLDGEVLEEAQRIGNAASRMIKSVDDIGGSIEVSEKTKFNRLVTDNLALEVWDLSKGYDKNSIIGLKILSDGSGEVINTDDLISLFTPDALEYGKADATILLPREFIEEQIGKDPKISIRLAMNVYADTGLYEASLASNNSKTNLNSKVIAAKILINNVPITDLGPYNVTTVFLPKLKLPEEDREKYSVCAFWDFDDNNGLGGWQTEGCQYLRMESGRDVCICDHLTNFAVLVSFYDQGETDSQHETALGIISIVGLVLSIIGLSLSIISFLCIKKLRQGRPQQTLFNLSVALLLSWIVFLAGIGRTENHAGCIAVAAILHYLIMASFMWMLMEGILQYLLFVRVMNTYFTNYMVKTAVPAWGLPIIPVVIVLAIDPELYRGGENYCWMSLDAFYYAFAMPVGLIILTNLIIFILVVVSLCRRKDMSKHSSQSSSQTVVNFRASFICFFVLGLSWIFGFLTIEDARTVFQYIFCITSTLQGFVIFLMMTARDKNVRQYWKSVCCRCLSDSRQPKTYRTWGDKGTGSSSNSGVQPVAQHIKNGDGQHTTTTSNTSFSSTDGSELRPDNKRRGYGNEDKELGNALDDIQFTVRDNEDNE